MRHENGVIFAQHICIQRSLHVCVCDGVSLQIVLCLILLYCSGFSHNAQYTKKSSLGKKCCVIYIYASYRTVYQNKIVLYGTIERYKEKETVKSLTDFPIITLKVT